MRREPDPNTSLVDAYIYDGIRTPFGRHAGTLASVRPMISLVIWSRRWSTGVRSQTRTSKT